MPEDLKQSLGITQQGLDTFFAEQKKWEAIAMQLQKIMEEKAQAAASAAEKRGGAMDGGDHPTPAADHAKRLFTEEEEATLLANDDEQAVQAILSKCKRRRMEAESSG